MEDSSSDIVEQFLLQKDEVLQLLKLNLTKAQKRMKVNADKACTNIHFQVGDWVYIKFKPHHQHFFTLAAFPQTWAQVFWTLSGA